MKTGLDSIANARRVTDETLWATTREVILFALLAVFLVTSLLLGSFRTGTVVVVTVFLTVVNVMGVMGVWQVSLNPLSLVNLVISVGIAVEFCSHIARAFMGASGGGLPYDHPAGERDRDERAWQALVDVGSSVSAGRERRGVNVTDMTAFTGRLWHHRYEVDRHFGPRSDAIQVARSVSG